MSRGETKEVQNSYSWSSQRGKSHKIRAFLKKKKPLHENISGRVSLFRMQKSFLQVATSLGRSFFSHLKGLQLYESERVSVLVSMQLVLMTVPFPPVFAVVHPPVKQTEPYEAQQCSLLFKTWFKNQASFSVSHSSLPTQKGKCLGVWQGTRKAPTWGAWENSQHFVMPPLVFPTKWCLRNERRNSILMRCHYQELGSLSDG